MQNDPGFDPSPMLTLEVTVSPQNTPAAMPPITRFLDPALAAIQQMPGVDSAAAIQLIPYDSWGWNFNVRYEGQPGDNPTQMPLVENRIVTPIFRRDRQRLIRGRLLRNRTTTAPDAPYVVVVNQALVERDFTGRDPIGERYYTGDTTFGTIVGVVSNIRNVGPIAPPTARDVFDTTSKATMASLRSRS